MKFEDYQPDGYVKLALPKKQQDFTHGQLWPTLVSILIYYIYYQLLLKETFTTYLTCVFIYLFQLNDDDDTLQQQRLKDMKKGVKVLRKMEQQRRADHYNMSTRVYKCSNFRLYPLRQLFNNYLKLHAATPEIIDLMIQAADYGALEEVHRVRDNQLKQAAIGAFTNRQKRQFKLDIAKNDAEFEGWVERARFFEN